MLNGAAWLSMVRRGSEGCSMAQYGAAWLSMVRRGSVWCSVAQYGAAWLSMVRCGSVGSASACCNSVRQARFRFLARHHREVFPTEHTSDEEMERGLSEWRWIINELYECG
jgi:hypothetical protein